MWPVEERLKDWNRLYLDLRRARRRFVQTEAYEPWNTQVLTELQAEIDRLRHESDLALNAIQAEITAIKDRDHPWQPSLF